ncbi:CDP-alcohol phosphatidyltransferase family protein [Argonema antarcticum]|uniref:CDP-alcohol phosphatidyltransferase family protein n=1 Tax=Argonema antarcticum TaxID=2942763 RepID=UPI002012A73A|nr:CDP-alcohol phosphatidyltransferase family protein [Argonema antarcticum]MCL1475865.1 CDP-alcohol phosphatidyltransferase family protein [Argonema antarcticum A004/B2]
MVDKLPQTNLFQTVKSETIPLSILQQLDLANLLTLTGLMLSFLAAIFSFKYQFYGALICLIYAGLTDVFDGFVSERIRRNKWQSAVGKELDSLVDICSFGFSPAIFAYCFGLQDILSIVLLMMYLAASGLRLAFFNCTGLYSEAEKHYYIGMPVTYVALFIPLTFLANFVLSESKMKILLMGLYLVLTVMMVSPVKVIKFKGIWYIVVLLGGLALTLVYAWAIAFPK